jgi:hypothetical protein
MLLSRLHGLSELHISSCLHGVILHLMRPTLTDLEKLPKGIISLSLDFVEAFRDEHLEYLPPQLTRLSLPHNRSITRVGLSKLAPSVVELVLKGNIQITSPLDLPRWLSSFEGNSTAMMPYSGFGADLPPTLTELKLWSNAQKIVWRIGDLACFHACSDLLTLAIEPIGRVRGKPAPFDFPPSLVALHLAGSPFLSKSLVSALPKSLQILNCEFLAWADRLEGEIPLDWDDSTVLDLPAGLQSLVIMPRVASWRGDFIGLTPSLLTPNCFPNLPVSLKSLQLWALNPCPVDASEEQGNGYFDHDLATSKLANMMAFLPKSLNCLHVFVKTEDESLYPAFWTLPSSLTSAPYMVIEAPWEDPMVESVARDGDQPSTSVEMDERSANRRVGPVFDSIAVGSEHRTSSVQLRSWVSLEDWIELATLIPPLQKTLRSLTIGQSWVSRGHLTLNELILPERLTSLSLRISKYPIIDKHILYLPESITVLDIGSSELLTDECLPALPHDITSLSLGPSNLINGNMYPFPPKLRSISLGECLSRYARSYAPNFPHWVTTVLLDSVSINDEWFRSKLPRFLTTLVLAKAENVPPDILLAHLPSMVTDIDIPQLQLEDHHVQMLPAGLRFFRAESGCSNLSDTCAPFWPVLLHTLVIPGALITPRGISQLPKSLTTLVMRDATLFTIAEARQHLKRIELIKTFHESMEV